MLRCSNCFVTSSHCDLKPRLAELLGPEARDLIKILPELRRWLPDIPTAPSLDPARERRLAIDALSTILIRLTEEQPVLIVIEDLHWSDDTSLDALLHLARRIRGVPLLLLMTFRDDEITTNLGHMLATMDRERLSIELTLSRLARDDVAAMIGAIFSGHPPVTSPFRDALHALTDGNPFFIEEILKSLVTANDESTPVGSWDRRSLVEMQIPRSVQDAVQRRVDQLTVDAKNLLQIAAVAGRRCDFRLLQFLTRHSEDQLLDLIKELIQAQLLVEESTDHFVFRHALTREAIYIVAARPRATTASPGHRRGVAKISRG